LALSTRQKMTIGRALQWPILALRGLFGRPPVVAVRRRGIRWRLDLREGIDFSIFLLGRFEPSTAKALARLIKPGDTVLDIGANVGAHTLPLARAVGAGGRVIAFEPTAFAYGKMTGNLAMNPELAKRVTAEQMMLVADEVTKPVESLYSSWPLDGGAREHETHGGRAMSTEGAQAATLDGYLAEAGIERVDAIKMDVDGWECDVLAGARRTLMEYGPPIVMELAPYVLSERGHSLEELVGLLRAAGYGFRDEADTRDLPDEAAALAKLAPEGGGINILARRR
jgi:FkbM family methyltransferase